MTPLLKSMGSAQWTDIKKRSEISGWKFVTLAKIYVFFFFNVELSLPHFSEVEASTQSKE